MSYILDALRKSERERPPRPVPDLFTVHGPLPPEPRRPVRAFVAAAVLLVVPVVALWIWFGTDRRPGQAVRPSAVAVAPPQREETPVSPAISRAVVETTPPAPVRAAPAASRLPAGKRQQASAPPARALRETAAAAVPQTRVPPVPPHAAPQAPVPAEPAPVGPAAAPPVSVVTAIPMPTQAGGENRPAQVPAGEPPPVGTPAAPTAAAPAPAAEAEEAPPADGRVLDLIDLPAPIRAELPKLYVSGHVWSEEPSLRLLSVDDRLLREGGEVAAGVSLREITPAGAVLSFKGWRFRVTGGRP